MKARFALTAFAMLRGTTALADDGEDRVVQAFEGPGHEDVGAQYGDDRIIVIADRGDEDDWDPARIASVMACKGARPHRLAPAPLSPEARPGPVP